MAEQRLIDANEAKKSLLSYYSFVNENTSKSNYTGETLMSYEVADMVEDCIDNAPTIDPETLPIVQDLRSRNERLKAVVKVQLEQLREKTAEIDELCEKVADLDEKLHRVTAERDAVKHDIEEAMKISEQEVPGFLCEFCAKNPFCVKCSEPEWRGAQKEG